MFGRKRAIFNYSHEFGSGLQGEERSVNCSHGGQHLFFWMEAIFCAQNEKGPLL